ncbi:uncharacterized protein [Typha latifolia]|uniref:uncharacterized protein n=1 Tax=Typha latifolia TaxID=4733 RepID=UPI003C2F86EA
MYHDVRRYFWWPGLKKSIAEFVGRCLICQQVKIEHQRPAGTLRSLPIPEWKWEHITMDFVVGLPKTLNKKDSIWVIVDRLTKSAHFLLALDAPYEALYGRKCRTPVSWDKVGERKIESSELIQETVDKVEDKAFPKVSSWKGVFRFGKKGKLSLRYIGPYEILARIGLVVYRVVLLSKLSQIHNVFIVSVLRKYLYDLSHVLREELIQLGKDLSYEEQLVRIIDRCVKTLRRRVVPFWRHHGVEEATWALSERIDNF